MALQPWYRVVYPREDLRENKPLDASEFAVHLDQVRDNRARPDYQDPRRFFERTFLTQNLLELAAGAVRRLSGEITATSAVYNLATQFGGGKTHALTLLWHLANSGSDADTWPGVQRILDVAGLSTIPQSRAAAFVGTEFDSITGRGGSDGTPLRKTPWGEIAFQLGGEEAFAIVAEHERQFIEPKGDVIRAFLPKDRPCLILMDEIINYVSTYRSLGYHNRLYNFIQALSETARGLDNVVLVVSIPASELEYTAEDEADEQRFRKMLDRLGKAIMMSAESETSEIIRRRLFEWDEQHLTRDGRVILPREADATCKEYARWVIDHRLQLPSWFPIDDAHKAFAATYPFHPSLLSVFERKWQALPRFQRTRGVLRLLALWVSQAYTLGFQGAHRDPLIGLGTAPLDDPTFRAAVFEQLGESRLEAAVTTDIAGRPDAHALRLDAEDVDTIRQARLHRKTVTAIFFESNGGQTRAEATVPELRLAVAEPDLDLGNVETVLEALTESCYYLYTDRNRYWFRSVPNLNKLLADRRASIQPTRIEERVREEIQRVFGAGSGVERVFFPEQSGQVPDHPALRLVVLAPERSFGDDDTLPKIRKMTSESGTSSRTFKSGLVWCVAEAAVPLYEEARKLLAWEEIDRERDMLRLEEWQGQQLTQDIQRAKRDLREAVWRTYKNLVLLGKDGQLKHVDLGLIHSSAADTMVNLILNRLRSDGDVEDSIGPNFLVRNWPPAFIDKPWSTRAVRNAFFASPQFPRLIRPDAISSTIARGVSEGHFAYVGLSGGGYAPFYFGDPLSEFDVEIADDMFIITRDAAEAYLQALQAENDTWETVNETGDGGPVDDMPGVESVGDDDAGGADVEVDVEAGVTRIRWRGVVPNQKWMTFYNKVLARFVSRQGLQLTVQADIEPEGGISDREIQETRAALHELGLDDTLDVE